MSVKSQAEFNSNGGITPVKKSKHDIENVLSKEELDFLYSQNYAIDYSKLFEPIEGRTVRLIDVLEGFLEEDYVMKYSDENDNPINEYGTLCKSILNKLYSLDE